MGNRIAKYVYNGSELESSTFYVRDAQGTTIAPETNGSRYLGKRLYELSNHLGNVLTVISDRKMAVPMAGTSEVWYYRPHLVSVTDYSPFGVALTARTWSDQEYRYGFQAQEQDNEMWSGSVSFKYRVEDPRLGRFFCVDPLVKRIVHYSPFAFAGSKPISCFDFEGLEDIHYLDSFVRRQGCPSIEVLESTQLGCEILEEFRNTDPQMCEGKVNIGYDAFVCAAPLGDNVMGNTSVLFTPGSLIRDVDVDGTPYLRDGREAVLEAIEKKSGAVWDRLAANFPQEVLNSEEFKASVSEGKGIIVVTVNEELFKENFSSSVTSPVLPVTIGHEFGAHCLNKSQGVEMTAEEEHGDFCGEESLFTIPHEGSKQLLLQDQVIVEIEARNE